MLIREMHFSAVLAANNMMANRDAAARKREAIVMQKLSDKPLPIWKSCVPPSTTCPGGFSRGCWLLKLEMLEHRFFRFSR
jgi:hypothetical protein